jgi:hypothetical protein
MRQSSEAGHEGSKSKDVVTVHGSGNYAVRSVIDVLGRL